MTLKSALLRLLAISAANAAGLVATAQADVSALFPTPPEVREILDQRCVFCHGEIIDGKAEIREDLELTSDERMAETIGHIKDFIEMIDTGEMPHEAKLSFRLRKNPEMQDRLKSIRAAYDENGDREVLLAWLKKAL